MKRNGHTRWPFYILMSAAVWLIIISVIMLARTFNHYNELSLQRQDSQLESMAQTADAGMANYLNDYREELRYVIGRRGFLNAEEQWHQTGDTSALLTRMQENLVTGNPLIHYMLALRENEVFLSSAGDGAFYFPDGMEGPLKPCFAGDGAMYLALFEEGQHARYAVLLSMKDWYAQLAETYASDSIHLLLMGSQQRILLHTWMGQQYVNIMDDLTSENCDMQALRHMLQSSATATRLTASYELTYPGDDFVHEMRMTVLPLGTCANGYFAVCLTSDYDEIIRPMQGAAWGLLGCGALLVAGVLLLILTAALLVRQNRHRDRELEHLIKRNTETQKLLEKTTELAHHQRLETIGTLTASIAHEFNNLLTPIMGYAILTLEGLPEDSDDLADNITEIYEASRKAKDIISRLNELSRKNTESTFTPLSLSTIIEKALQVAAPAQPSRVTTRLAIDAEECLVSGNETQLSQLMLNLILNAYHAMEEREGVLTLTLRTQGNQAIAVVQDDGPGIPEAALPHIFEPFFTTKESGRGTGLGLAIVRQVAQNHHGDITVESIPGMGSVFTLTLPLADQPDRGIS